MTSAGAGSRPDQLLVYDGGCGVCGRLATLAARFAEGRVERFAAYQELTAADLEATGLTREDCARSLRFRDARGRVHAGAYAVNRFLLAAAPPGMRGALVRAGVWAFLLLPPLLHVEIALYEVFARNRHRISGWFGMSCAGG